MNILPRTDDSIVIKISGPAGAGIMLLSDILVGAFNKAGYYCLSYPEYESRIRGGDNNIQIVVSNKPYLSARLAVDVLFAFGQSLKVKHQNEVKPGGLVFESGELGLDKIREVKENALVINLALAGFVWKFFFASSDILLSQINISFNKKIALLNQKAAIAGFKLNGEKPRFSLVPASKKLFCATGNEVFAQACVKAGVGYASIYPMTPITSLLDAISKTKIKVVQPEDEIFAALSTIGASYAGTRAVTATSGGGFCLMSEAVGFACMAEIPMVVIMGQRSGPSSGMPTYSSQADLNFAIFSSHGEADKIVLSPGDLNEVSQLTQKAFNLADHYQIPVIILTDKYLSETRFATERAAFDRIKVKINRGKRFSAGQTKYKRYALERDGISARAYPGETTFITNSYEHDEYGFSTDDVEIHLNMAAKRRKKLANLSGGFDVFGNRDSKTLIIGWGSTKTQLLEFVSEHPKVKYIHVWRPWPFPSSLVKEIAKTKKIIVVENNATGQMAGLIRMETGIKTTNILKDDGRPFFREELFALLGKEL